MRKFVYLDHNATTRPAPEVRASLMEWLENWGNPSSIHQAGRGPKSLMRWSRLEVAKALGCDPLEVVFTSSGSEANNFAIKSAFRKQKSLGRTQILVSSVEHPSVLKSVQSLVSEGAKVEWISVSREGQIDLAHYESLLCPQTALVTCMVANNETGTIFPIGRMAKLAHEVRALFHADAVQALGKIPIDCKRWGVDLLSISGHKFYALKGAGALFVKRGTQIEPLIHGGGQERSRRAGTENVLAIASLASVCSKLNDLEVRSNQMAELRQHLERRILSEIPCVKITAAESPRLPNTSSLIIEGVDGETMLMNLDMLGFCVSTGAACSSGSQEPSPALRAMGLSRTEAQSSLRVSLGWENSADDIDQFVDALKTVVMRVRTLNQKLQSERIQKDISESGASI